MLGTRSIQFRLTATCPESRMVNCHTFIPTGPPPLWWKVSSKTPFRPPLINCVSPLNALLIYHQRRIQRTSHSIHSPHNLLYIYSTHCPFVLPALSCALSVHERCFKADYSAQSDHTTDPVSGRLSERQFCHLQTDFLRSHPRAWCPILRYSLVCARPSRRYSLHMIFSESGTYTLFNNSAGADVLQPSAFRRKPCPIIRQQLKPKFQVLLHV